MTAVPNILEYLIEHRVMLRSVTCKRGALPRMLYMGKGLHVFSREIGRSNLYLEALLHSQALGS